MMMDYRTAVHTSSNDKKQKKEGKDTEGKDTEGKDTDIHT